MERSELDQTERGNLYAPHADNVFILEASIDEVRDLIGFVEDDNLNKTLDEAQGHVGMGRAKRAFVVIKIA